MPVGPWKKFYRFIDAVSLVTQEKHFKRSLGTLTHSLGFELYAYISISSKSSFALSNYPKEWQDRYLRKSYQMRTVNVHIGRLRKALSLDGTADLIRTVRSIGYALEGSSLPGTFADSHGAST